MEGDGVISFAFEDGVLMIWYPRFNNTFPMIETEVKEELMDQIQKEDIRAISISTNSGYTTPHSLLGFDEGVFVDLINARGVWDRIQFEWFPYYLIQNIFFKIRSLSTCDHLVLKRCNIVDENIEGLCSIVSSCNIRTLDLCYNEITNASSFSGMNSLWLSFNPVTSESLCELIRTTQMEELYVDLEFDRYDPIESFRVYEMCPRLFDIADHTPEHLQDVVCDMRRLDCGEIAKAVSQTSLRVLDFGYSIIENLVPFGEAIRLNTTLKELSLGGRLNRRGPLYITEQEYKSLYEGLIENHTLESLQPTTPPRSLRQQPDIERLLYRNESNNYQKRITLFEMLLYSDVLSALTLDEGTQIIEFDVGNW